MKPFNSSERNSNKVEQSKIQQDLKEVLDRQCSLTSTCNTSAEQKRNPLQDFFVDEVELTRKLLHIVRTDLDALSFDDDEVRTRKKIIIFLLFIIINIYNNYILYTIYDIEDSRALVYGMAIRPEECHSIRKGAFVKVRDLKILSNEYT